MQFFDHDIVRSEAAELMRIQEDLNGLFSSGKFRSPEGREVYFFLMERLLDIQEIIYFRAKYSELDDAKEYVQMLKNHLHLVAREGEYDVSHVYSRMKRDLRDIKNFVMENP
jgi:hypothetical protein